MVKRKTLWLCVSPSAYLFFFFSFFYLSCDSSFYFVCIFVPDNLFLFVLSLAVFSVFFFLSISISVCLIFPLFLSITRISLFFFLHVSFFPFFPLSPPPVSLLSHSLPLSRLLLFCLVPLTVMSLYHYVNSFCY